MSDIFSKILRHGLVAMSLLAVMSWAAMGEPIDLSVGGYFTQGIAMVDSDEPKDSNLEDTAFLQNAEIHFKARTRLDDGTQIGLQIQLEAEQSDDQIDEHYIYAKGDWGKLIVGAENGVAHLGEVTGPKFVAGLKAYNNSLTDAVIEKAYDTIFEEADIIEDANMSTKIEHISGDANKLSYFTPKISGAQIGFSFTPNNADRKGGESNFDDIEGGQEDIIEVAASYSGRFNNGSFKIGVAMAAGDNVDDNAASAETTIAVGDPESMGFGVVVNYDNWTIGGNQTTYENLAAVGVSYDANLNNTSKYALSKEIATTYYGITYKMGRHKFGIGITSSEETRYDTTGASIPSQPIPIFTHPKIEYAEMLIGGTTKLAAGVSVGYYYQDTEATLGDSSKAVSLIGATLALKF